MAIEDTDDFADSGPFCIHFSDPSDCLIPCATCGHECVAHSGGQSDCSRADCECKEFKDEVVP